MSGHLGGQSLRASLYDHLYTRHVDCADHLCNDESSAIEYSSDSGDSFASVDNNSDAHYYESVETPEDSVSDNVSASADIQSESTPRAADSGDPEDPGCHAITSGEETVEEVDPFGDYFDKGITKKGRKGWRESMFRAFGVCSRGSRSDESPKDVEDDKSEPCSDPWGDFANAQSGEGSRYMTTGTVSGEDSMHIPLPHRGFYTVFLRNSKAFVKRKQGIYVFKLKLSYKVFDFKRKRICLQPSGGDFIPHDILADDNFAFSNEGCVTIAGRDTRILLLYATQDGIAEFTLSHNVLAMKPSLLYRIVYSGWCSAVPLSLSPKLRLRILSIDSCENLGTSALAALYALELRLSSMNGMEANIGEHFDLICASGTGAIIALCLLKGYSIRDLWVQWQSILDQLFKWRHSRAYGLMFDHEHVHQFVRSWMDILGTDFMCSRARPLCVITSANVKSAKHDMFVFRNYTNVHASYGKTAFAPMWLAGWASNSLPTYMKGPTDRYLRHTGCVVDRSVHFVDSKLLSSNPAIVALREASELYGTPVRTLIDETIDVFLSVGTTRKRSRKVDDPAPWQILLDSNDSCGAQVEHGHMRYLFEERPEVYYRIEMGHLPGCSYGKTSKPEVDEVFNRALEVSRTQLADEISRIAECINA